MSRQIPISSVSQSGANPGSFVLGPTVGDNPSGDWTGVFKGKFYRDPAGLTQTFYNANGTLRTPPAGYQLISATTFTIIENPSYNGRYTVYTQEGTTNDPSNPSSTFGGGLTTVRVNEPIGAPQNASHLTNTGFVTNVSTYYLLVANESPIIVPSGVILENRPVEFVGRNYSGWGELIHQNLIELAQHYSGATAPTNPFLGQIWYDTTSAPFLAKIYDGSAWSVLNSTFFAPANSFRHTQATAATTWTVNHNLNASSPFIVHATFFVDTGGGVIKPILPQDMTYVSANQLTVTFSTTYSGYALIRL